MECLFFITNLYDIFMRTVHNYAAPLQYVCKLFLSFNPFFLGVFAQLLNLRND